MKSTKMLTLVSAMFLLAGTASAQVFKIATIAPENSAWMIEMRAAAAEIGERTSGRVTVKYYGGGVMGNDRKVLRKMRIGQLQGGAFAASGLLERFPALCSTLWSCALLFASLEEVDYVHAEMWDRTHGRNGAGRARRVRVCRWRFCVFDGRCSGTHD